MAAILIVNRKFTQLSETFIYRQMDCLRKNHSIDLLAYAYENEILFPLGDARRNLLTIYVNMIDKGLSVLLRRVFRRSLSLSLFNSLFLFRLIRRKDTRVVHVHYGPNALKVLDVVRKARVPMVVSFHGFDASKALRKESYLRRLPDLFDYAAAIILCSTHMANALPLKGYESKVHVVPYGIDPDEFRPVSGRVHSGKTLRIVHSGRIVSKKGVPDLISVFAELVEEFSNIELHILGDGTERSRCEQLVTKLGIGEHVKFYGAQPQKVVKELLASADVFVLNSRVAANGDMEGLPNTILEAMSMAKPVISTLHAGIPDVIQNGVNGILVPERANEELKAALAKVIGDEQLRLRLGSEARRRIVESFTVEAMNERLTTIFDNLVHAGP